MSAHGNKAKTGGVLRFIARLLKREEGAVAVQFAIIALPLAVLSLGLIDVNRASMSKRTLQDALDAAALIVARSDADTNAEAQTIGAAALAAQLSASGEGSLISSTFTLGGTGNSKVIAQASVAVDPVVADLWLQGNMTVGAKSEVMRSSANLEVALVLDVTGSMKGTPLADLKLAAKDLVDLVVQDVQTPFYSKVSLVPYSMGVNMGSSAGTARGPVAAAKSMSGASWSTGSSKNISGATKANPVVISSNGHGFANGDRVYISGVKGMTQLNGKVYTVANKQNNSFQLQGVDGRYYSTYSSSGKITKCQQSNCEVVVTSNGHGFSNGDAVYITGVSGMTDLNNSLWTVKSKATNTFVLDDSFGPDYSSYSSGGSIWCTTPGCKYYAFNNMYGSQKVFEITDCVTERVSGELYTDASPATAYVGRNYRSGGSGCLGSQITALSSNKTSLKATIEGYEAEGSTAGHIGLAWGWYSVSPNFSSIFTGSSTPAAYGTKDLIKVVVLMTDGEFNTGYCNGVTAQTSGDGSGSNNDKINCDATNGSPYDQAAALCTAMKAKDIIVYTVGFNISDSKAVTDLLSGCATSPGHYFLPNSGTDLKKAFKAIGQDITNLRISK